MRNNDLFELNGFIYKDLMDNLTPWQVIGNLTDIINKFFGDKKVLPNFKDKKDVHVGEGTYIHPTVDFAGPAIIGKNCKINHAAYFRGGVILGDNVIIGHAVEVKNSIFLNNSTAAHLNYIGDSVIGNYVNISGGAILANYRLDKKNILIKSEKGKIDTGLEKFGAAIGDNSVIGVNSVINPGTILGKNTIVYPLKSITGVHEHNSILS